MEKILLTPKECAEALSIGRTRMYSMLAQSQLPSVRIGRSIRVPVAALERWVEAHQGGASGLVPEETDGGGTDVS